MKPPALITTSSSLGDLLSITPTIRKLFYIYGEKITVISPIPDVLKNNPYILKNIHIDTVDLGFLENSYTLHKTFHNLGKKDPLGIEFKHAMCDIRQFHAKDLGFLLTPEEMRCDFFPDDKEECMGEINLPENYVVIHPAQTWDSRTWESEKWQTLVELLNEKNVFVVSVGKNSGEYSNHISQDKPAWSLNIKNGVDLTNKTTLSQTWHILNESNCVITMDSGILHLAGTTDTHIIQLGSSINPRFRAPYRYGKQEFKYSYIVGSCQIHCASDLSYSLRDWGSIQAVTLINTCLENKKDFPCKPDPISVANKVIEILESTKVEESISEFSFEKEELVLPNKPNFVQNEPVFEVNIQTSYTDGPRVEITGDNLDKRKFIVRFSDDETGEDVYTSTIKINHWTKSSRTFYTKWKISVWTEGNLIYEEILDLKGKDVFVGISNTALGDTLAWAPYVLEFEKIHGCNLTIGTVHHKLLSGSYPEYNWVDTYSQKIENFYATYWLSYGVSWELHSSEMKIVNKNYFSRKGNLYSDKVKIWDEFHHRRNPHKITLAAIGSDILGLKYREIRTKIFNPNPEKSPLDKKYVCISEFASSRGLKEWNNKIGWQKLVDELNSLGYKVVSISKEKSTLKNVIKRNGNYDLIDRSWYLHHCEFFIGVSSGLCWLAWACGKKVVMISGATQSWNEFQEDNIRIINKEVCHGCWNSEEHSDKFGCFHPSFCPENKNFECTRKISPQFVIDRIKEEGLIND